MDDDFFFFCKTKYNLLLKREAYWKTVLFIYVYFAGRYLLICLGLELAVNGCFHLYVCLLPLCEVISLLPLFFLDHVGDHVIQVCAVYKC